MVKSSACIYLLASIMYCNLLGGIATRFAKIMRATFSGPQSTTRFSLHTGVSGCIIIVIIDVAPSSDACYAFIKIKSSACHLLLYVVYTCQKSFIFIQTLSCYKQKCKLAPFNLVHPVCVCLQPFSRASYVDGIWNTSFFPQLSRFTLERIRPLPEWNLQNNSSCVIYRTMLFQMTWASLYAVPDVMFWCLSISSYIHCVHNPPYLQLATSEVWCWSGGRGILKKKTVSVTVLCTIIMLHKDTSSSYRLVDCIGLWSCLV